MLREALEPTVWLGVTRTPLLPVALAALARTTEEMVASVPVGMDLLLADRLEVLRGVEVLAEMPDLAPTVDVAFSAPATIATARATCLSPDYQVGLVLPVRQVQAVQLVPMQRAISFLADREEMALLVAMAAVVVAVVAVVAVSKAEATRPVVVAVVVAVVVSEEPVVLAALAVAARLRYSCGTMARLAPSPIVS